MEDRNNFYQKTLNKLIFQSHNLFLFGAGDLDKKVFEESGFHDVTISNLDVKRMQKFCTV